MRTTVSRYKDSDLITYDGERMHGIRDKIDTSEQFDDSIYSVKAGDDLKNIAFNLYKDARLWWVVAEFNDIIDPFENMRTGKNLRYPSLVRITRDIL